MLFICCITAMQGLGAMNVETLILEIDSGNYQKVKELIEQGVNVNEKSEVCTPLFRAIWAKQFEIAQLLLAKGADANEKVSSMSPLQIAINAGCSVDMVKSLVHYGANVNARAYNGSTPLQDAARYGALGIVQFLLQKKANLEDKDDILQYTPLLWALNKKQFKVAEFLVESGANVNAKDFRGSTPLHVAAEKGGFDIVKLLIKKGAIINAKTDRHFFGLVKQKLENCPKKEGETRPSNSSTLAADTIIEPVSPMKAAQKRGHFAIAEYLQTVELQQKIRATLQKNKFADTKISFS